MVTYEQVLEELKQMHKERNWHNFHTSKDVLIALVGEIGELAELYRWLDNEQIEQMHCNPEKKQKIAHEMADILSYLMTLAYKNGIDLPEALSEKNKIIKERYPVKEFKNKNTNVLDGNKR